MKAFKLTIFLYVSMIISTTCFASPSIYITTRMSNGGLFKLNMATKQAERIDSYSADHDFTSLNPYGSNQLMAASYAGTNGIMIFNEDGSLDQEISTIYNSVAAIEKPNADGDIYYTQYTQATVQLLDVQTGSSSTVRVTPFNYAWHMTMRSDGELYVAEWLGNYRIIQVSTGTIINTTNSPLFLESDDYGNLYKNSGYSVIQKIGESHSVSTFWADPSILLYNFAYDSVEDVFYGLGKENATGYLNLYQFDLSGNASVYLHNVDGLTGGYGGNPPEVYSNMLVLNGSIPTAIPEPASMFLLALGILGIIRKRLY